MSTSKRVGRLIDDDIKVEVLPERVPEALSGHLVLESPQLANVESKFPVMRGLVQHWCRSRKTFAPLRSSAESAAVSTTASESDVSVSALAGMDQGLKRSREGKGQREAKEKEKR